MLDISDKITTLRIARARAVVRVYEETIQKILNCEVPKGDVIKIAKTYAIVGAKKTPELIPFCHNIPVEWVDSDVRIEGSRIMIEVTAKTTYKTGCEMEALTERAARPLRCMIC